MLTCMLKEKRYTVDFVTGRALREIGPASDMVAALSKAADAAVRGEETADSDLSIEDALDVMIAWFCLLFGNQFTPDDVLDGYPADRLISDISVAILAVKTQMTQILSDFPMTAATEPKTVS